MPNDPFFSLRLLGVMAIACLGVLSSSFAAPDDSANTTSRADELIAYLTKVEKEAAQAIGNEKSSAEAIQALVPTVESGLATINSSESLRLANGDSTLQDLRPLLVFRLAALHARLGHKEEAFQLLHSVLLELPGWLRGDIPNSAAFASLAEDPDFKQLKTRLARVTALWDGSSFATDFTENLSEDEKIAGLSVFWSEVKNNFMDPSRLVELEWDRLYLSYLPRVRQSQSTFEYYRLLQEMCARLQDGHSRIWMPRELHSQQVGAGGLETGLIEDKVLILAVDSETLRDQGIRPGQEITRVDGIPVRKYAEERVAPYQSASTPQDLAAQVYSQNLTAGPKDNPVELELRTTGGDTVSRSIARNWNQSGNRPLVESRMLEGNIAYVAINSLNDPNVVSEFGKAFADTVQRANALILDIRNNGGGNSGNGYEVLNYLTDQPYLTSSWKTRSYSPTFRSWGKGLQWRSYPAGEIKPNRPKYFTGPVALLIGPRTYSAAEDFCIAFRNAKRGLMIGELTGGSTGNPLFVRLPGGGGATICTKLDSYPDGSLFVGVGIRPDKTVAASIEDVRAGRDRVLETAIKTLSEKQVR